MGCKGTSLKGRVCRPLASTTATGHSMCFWLPHLPPALSELGWPVRKPAADCPSKPATAGHSRAQQKAVEKLPKGPDVPSTQHSQVRHKTTPSRAPKTTPANWSPSMCYRVEIPATDALPCIRISLQLTIRPCEDSEELHRYHPGRDFTMRCVQCGSTGSNLEANCGPKEERVWHFPPGSQGTPPPRHAVQPVAIPPPASFWFDQFTMEYCSAIPYLGGSPHLQR